MKVKVIVPFVDKYDHSIGYEVGTVLDWDDENRVKTSVKNGFVEIVSEDGAEEAEKPKKKTAKAKPKKDE